MITLSTLNQAHQALMGQAHGLPLPLRYAGIVPETEAMVGGLALLDLESCGVMLLKGAQAGKFLNGLLTNDIATLAVGGVGAGFLCGPKGKVLFSLTAARIKPDEYLAVTDPGALEAVAAHMDFYHVREEVELGRVGLTRLELFGPLARSALDGLKIPSRGEPGRFQDQPVLAYPLPFGTLPRWMVLAAAPVAGGLAQALLDGEPRARMAGFEAFEEARIWAGIPRWGAEFPRERFPQELSMEDVISYTKGCYVGQEVHARMYHRGHPGHVLLGGAIPPRLARLLVQASSAPDEKGASSTQPLAPQPFAPLPLYSEGKPAGHLTSLGRLPRPAGIPWPQGVAAETGFHAALLDLTYGAAQTLPPLAVEPDGAEDILPYSLLPGESRR